jgi:hypothetical protein
MSLLIQMDSRYCDAVLVDVPLPYGNVLVVEHLYEV